METFEVVMYVVVLLAAVTIQFGGFARASALLQRYARMLSSLYAAAALFGIAGYATHDIAIFRTGWLIMLAAAAVAIVLGLFARLIGWRQPLSFVDYSAITTTIPATSSRNSPSLVKVDKDDLRSTRRTRLGTFWGLVGCACLALSGSMITAGSAAGTVLVLGVGFIALGFIVGLLFSMPKAAAHDDSTMGPVDGDRTEARSERLYLLNTNLEQVSDWLTKIIVGVGLVEARNLAKYVSVAGQTLGGEFHTQEPHLAAPAATALAMGMILALPAAGFLIGFFSVRLYISQAMYAVDAKISQPVSFSSTLSQTVARSWEKVTAVPTEFSNRIKQRSSVITSTAIDEVLRAPLRDLKDVSDLVTRGRAALLKGRTIEAASAFDLAIKSGGKDPALFLDYARTYLQDYPIAWPRVIEILQLALSNIVLDTTREIKQQIYWELLNAYLYLPPPNGYTLALRLGEPYVATSDGIDDSYAYVYLAAAHGQAYAYYKLRLPDQAAREIVLIYDQIILAITNAQQAGIEKSIRLWLRSLASTVPDANTDDDLYVAAHDSPEIFELIDEYQP